ncbi:hypothetical protein Q7P37_003512 [Cladosporium fusiforme]
MAEAQTLACMKRTIRENLHFRNSSRELSRFMSHRFCVLNTTGDHLASDVRSDKFCELNTTISDPLASDVITPKLRSTFIQPSQNLGSRHPETSQRLQRLYLATCFDSRLTLSSKYNDIPHQATRDFTMGFVQHRGTLTDETHVCVYIMDSIVCIHPVACAPSFNIFRHRRPPSSNTYPFTKPPPLLQQSLQQRKMSPTGWFLTSLLALTATASPINTRNAADTFNIELYNNCPFTKQFALYQITSNFQMLERSRPTNLAPKKHTTIATPFKDLGMRLSGHAEWGTAGQWKAQALFEFGYSQYAGQEGSAYDLSVMQGSDGDIGVGVYPISNGKGSKNCPSKTCFPWDCPLSQGWTNPDQVNNGSPADTAQEQTTIPTSYMYLSLQAQTQPRATAPPKSVVSTFPAFNFQVDNIGPLPFDKSSNSHAIHSKESYVHTSQFFSRMALVDHSPGRNTDTVEADVEAGISRPAAIHLRPRALANETSDEELISDQRDSARVPDRPLKSLKFWELAASRWVWILSSTVSKRTRYAMHHALRVLGANENHHASSEENDGPRKTQKEFIIGSVQVPVPKDITKRLERAGQTIFICIDQGRRDQFAIPIRCFRPTAHRRLKWWLHTYDEKIMSTARACESDYQIVERMREKLESECGLWMKFVPYYGVVSAEIVELRTKMVGALARSHLNGGKCPASENPLLMCIDEDPTRLGSKICGHARTCPSSKDPDQNCIDKDPKKVGAKRCGQTSVHNTDHCDYPVSGCIEHKREQAARVGIPGIEAFRRLPQWLNRPKGVSGGPLSKWMAQENLLSELSGRNRIVMPPDSRAHDGRNSHRGIKVTLGWDFNQMKVDAPSHLNLTVLAGSVVWLAVILWAEETNDINTAMAFGAVLVSFFTFLFSNCHGSSGK